MQTIIPNSATRPISVERGQVARGSVARRAIAPLLILILAVTAASTLAAPQEKSLYQRLGGKPAITAVVDQFVTNVAGDNRINHYFQADVADPARLATFKINLVNQICEGTGGPCKYTGKDMKTAHAGMGITDADFNALVEDLVSALNKFNVPDKEKNDLLAILGPMKPDIVTK
jgi:hemoglobin